MVDTDFSVKLSGEKSEELRCPYCDKFQTNKSSLSCHISTVHYFQTPFLNENTNLSVKKKQIENKDEYIPKQDCRIKDLDSKLAQKEHSKEITKMTSCVFLMAPVLLEVSRVTGLDSYNLYDQSKLDSEGRNWNVTFYA